MTRPFRTKESLESEQQRRDAVGPMLVRYGFKVLDDNRTKRGKDAITQVITAQLDRDVPDKLHVRLCWRWDGRNSREENYSAAQIGTKQKEGDWALILASIADRAQKADWRFTLFVQDSTEGIVLAALVPNKEIPAIWQQQREVSATLIGQGKLGRMRKNHTENGSRPTIYLQDDRWPAAHAVAQVLWDWPGVINILALPTLGEEVAKPDSMDDLPRDIALLGRDTGERLVAVRSGYPRDPKVRTAVLHRAGGKCEREGCGEQRSYPGFLDVHHILGVAFSDRAWTCVALCPNCHREAHFAPDRDAINHQLMRYAERFAGPNTRTN